jgi:hypothetical protein
MFDHSETRNGVVAELQMLAARHPYALERIGLEPWRMVG